MSSASLPRLCDLSGDPSVLRGLTSEQQSRLSGILDEYLQGLEAGLAPDFEELAGRHPDLAGTLKEYLGHLRSLHDAAGGFAAPVTDLRAVEREDAEDLTPLGRCLGDFRLVREVGRGGMGVVYEAEQLSLGRRVALKILPFAAVLDSQQIARFKNEAQAAAQLHHPNIVPVYAVGADRGVHYYAMQFIEGQSLDQAIAELRASSGARGKRASTEPAQSAVTWADGDDVGSRRSVLRTGRADRRNYFFSATRLGIQAAEALHAAHSYGVVHRDVKPSNLLLDETGKLWVTDFGLARCQTDATLTRTGDVVGTRRYMSPEQAAGGGALVDERSDVYSLGVTLYELLTLRQAFPAEDAAELLRQIDRHDPIRPTLLEPTLPKDLETVVLKAMSKLRDERYATAQHLADDLRRVVEGKPTVARPPSLADRVTRWTRRHARTVAAAVLLSIFVIGGLAASTFFINREKIKAQDGFSRADRNFRQARETVDQFGSQLSERLAGLPGAEQVRSDLLRETLGYYRRFAAQAKEDPSLQADLAQTYSKIGSLLDEIGNADEAIAAHREALALYQQLSKSQSDVVEYRRRLGITQNNLALALQRAGDIDGASGSFQDAIAMQKKLAGVDPDRADLRIDLAKTLNNSGRLASELDQKAQAEAAFREAIALQDRSSDASASDPEALGSLATSYTNLASMNSESQPAEALRLFQTAFAYQAKAAVLRPGDQKYQSTLALTLNNLGAVQARLKLQDEAAMSYTRAIELQRQLTQLSPRNRVLRRDLAVSCNNLGLTYSKLQRAGEAEDSFHEALRLQQELVAEDAGDAETQSSLGGIYNNLGILLEGAGRLPAAAEQFQQAVAHQRTAFERAPSVVRYREFLSKHYFNQGRVLRQLKRGGEAASAAMERKKLWTGDPDRLYSVAEELALASESLAALPQRRAVASQCAQLAISTLQEAAAAGHVLDSNVAHDKSFTALQNNPAFTALFHE